MKVNKYEYIEKVVLASRLHFIEGSKHLVHSFTFRLPISQPFLALRSVFWQLPKPLLSCLASFPTTSPNNKLCVISVGFNQFVSLLNWSWPQEQIELLASSSGEKMLKLARFRAEFLHKKAHWCHARVLHGLCAWVTGLSFKGWVHQPF